MSRRWSGLDTDAHRLPPGFTRSGYDSNTRRYQFTDAEGRMYQGEPGEEFGGRLTPVYATDPSMRHLFAHDDAEGAGVMENGVRGFDRSYGGLGPQDPWGDVLHSPPSSPEVDFPRPMFTPSEQHTETTSRTVPSFEAFLPPNQMATAPPPKPPQQDPTRSSKLSLKNLTASFMGFRSTKGKSAILPTLPSTEADEWGVAKAPPSP